MDEARRFLGKATRAIRAAQLLREAGDPDSAVGRAYYAMFYVTKALLVERGIRVRKHAGAHAAFGEHFVKTGVLDPKFHRWLLDAFDRRLEADYGVEAAITDQVAERTIEQALEFRTVVQELLKP